MNIKEIKYLNQVAHSLQQLAFADTGRPAVLVMGKTGSGKSALVNFLMGASLVLETQTDGMGEIVRRVVLDPAIAQHNGPVIGHTANSETLTPAMFACEGGYDLCDTGGLGDTRPGLRSHIYLLNREAIVKIHQVKSVVLVVRQMDLATRADGFTHLLEEVYALFAGEGDASHLLDNLRLVVTDATDTLAAADGPERLATRLKTILSARLEAVTDNAPNYIRLLQRLSDNPSLLFTLSANQAVSQEKVVAMRESLLTCAGFNSSVLPPLADSGELQEFNASLASLLSSLEAKTSAYESKLAELGRMTQSLDEERAKLTEQQAQLQSYRVQFEQQKGQFLQEEQQKHTVLVDKSADVGSQLGALTAKLTSLEIELARQRQQCQAMPNTVTETRSVPNGTRPTFRRGRRYHVARYCDKSFQIPNVAKTQLQGEINRKQALYSNQTQQRDSLQQQLTDLANQKAVIEAEIKVLNCDASPRLAHCVTLIKDQSGRICLQKRSVAASESAGRRVSQAKDAARNELQSMVRNCEFLPVLGELLQLGPVKALLQRLAGLSVKFAPLPAAEHAAACRVIAGGGAAASDIPTPAPVAEISQ